MKDLDIDDLQECMDDCPHGKRTQQNMKTVCGLVYKYGIPRNCVPNNLNLAEFLKVSGSNPAPRISFTEEQIEAIKNQIGRTFGADMVYSLIYLGFRPSEFLNLTVDQYDLNQQVIVGGAKTEKGTNRSVTLSPKIQPYMSAQKKRAKTALVCDSDAHGYTLQHWTETVFYPVLEAAGIDNPLEDIGNGNMRHRYTPHSCRHTFSTLMKRVAGADKDKLEPHSGQFLLF